MIGRSWAVSTRSGRRTLWPAGVDPSETVTSAL